MTKDEFWRSLFVTLLGEMIVFVLSKFIASDKLSLIAIIIGTIIAGLIGFWSQIRSAIKVVILIMTFIVGIIGFWPQIQYIFLPIFTKIGITTAPSIADPTLYDNFNNSANNGAFDPNLWQAAEYNIGKIAQTNGMLSIIGNSDLYARKFDLMEINKPIFFEAKLMYKLGESSSGTASTEDNVHLRLNAIRTNGNIFWFTECNIQYFNDNQGQIKCWNTDNVSSTQLFGNVYAANEPLVNYGTWHTVRIEIDPSTVKIMYYLDGQLIGTNIPAPVDVPLVKNAHFTLIVGVSEKGLETGFIDDVRVGSK